jgi:hypothetical protein
VYYSPCRRGDSDTVFSESNQSSIIKIPFSKSSLNIVGHLSFSSRLSKNAGLIRK